MTKEEIYNRLSASCAKKEMCKQDIYKWLIKFKIPKNLHNEIINQLVKEKFIDEERYAKSFANDSLKYNKWGKRKINFLLQSKQIQEDYIQAALDNLDNDFYESIKNELIISKRKTLAKDDPKGEEKVKAYLYGKGF